MTFLSPHLKEQIISISLLFIPRFFCTFRQKVLAEVIEHIHTGFLIHRGLVDLESSPNDPISAALKLGNKMAVLCGDFLHASASVALSDLRNSSVSR